MTLRRARTMSLAAALLLACAGSAGALEPVAPGDVLRIDVARAPELGREAAPVDLDGRISLPGVGRIAVAGVDLDAARARIEAALAAEGLLREPLVTVEIAAYRPVYVGGAVAEPGAVEFRPGLTVRRALILAGGASARVGADRLGAVELIELKAKWRARSFDLARADSRIARLRAELEAEGRPDFAAAGRAPADPEAAEAVIALDAAQFDDRMAARAALDAHLRETLDLLDFEIDVLTRQGALQEETQTIQREQLADSRTLYEKGVMTLPRLRALEFDLSRISREVLASRAFVARARLGKATAGYELESAETTRRIALRDALLEAIGARNAINAELEVLGAALMAAGLSLAEDAALTPLRPDLAIHRTAGEQAERLEAGMETALRPGDVLEVRLAGGRRGS